jgi:hypothetical protein
MQNAVRQNTRRTIKTTICQCARQALSKTQNQSCIWNKEDWPARFDAQHHIGIKEHIAGENQNTGCRLEALGEATRAEIKDQRLDLFGNFRNDAKYSYISRQTYACSAKQETFKLKIEASRLINKILRQF